MAPLQQLILYWLIFSVFLYTTIAQYQTDVKWERVEIVYQDSKYIHFNAFISRANRTSRGFTSYIELKQDMPLDSWGTIKLYMEHNNEYRHVPVTLSRKVCDFFNLEGKYIFMDMPPNVNFPIHCPVQKGNYSIVDWVVTSKYMPPNMIYSYKDVKNVMISTMLYFGKKILMSHINAYVKIDLDAKINGEYVNRDN